MYRRNDHLPTTQCEFYVRAYIETTLYHTMYVLLFFHLQFYSATGDVVKNFHSMQNNATCFNFIPLCVLSVHIQTYISSSDKAFTAATIEAIGRVACSISEVTETCLHGLMSLLSHKDGKGSSKSCSYSMLF